MGIVNDYRANLDLLPRVPDYAEDGLTVDELVDVGDENGLALKEPRGSRVLRRLEAELRRGRTDLIREVSVRRDVNDRPDPLVKAALENEKPDDSLSGTRVHLDDEVPLRATLMPLLPDLGLDVTGIAVLRGLGGKCAENTPWFCRLV